VLVFTAMIGAGVSAEEVEGEWTLVPLTMAVESVDADELLDEAARLRSGPNLTLGAPLEEATLPLRIDRRARTLALFGESVLYHMDGDRFVAEVDGTRIEFLFTPIGDAVLCEIVYRWPQFHAVLIAEAVPGDDAEGDLIYIDDPDAGTVEFERINEDRLYCEAVGLVGFYERE